MKRDPRLAQLSREHTQALMLALRVRRTIPSASDSEVSDFYSTLLRFWSAGLLPHFRAEGECLLARLVRHLSLEDPLVQRLHGDHLWMAALVATLRDTPDPGERRQLLLQFGETIEAHVHWEEQELFPMTEQQLSDPELEGIAEDLRERLPPAVIPWDGA
jgi:hypothetical protein